MEIDFTTQLAAARALQEILAGGQVLDYLHTVERLGGMPLLPIATDCFISAKQAGEELGISKQAIYRLVNSGKLQPYYLPDMSAMRLKLSDVLAIPKKRGSNGKAD